MLDLGNVDIEPGPVQSRELALATSAMTPGDVDRKTIPRNYYAAGYSQMSVFLGLLEKIGFDLRDMGAAMEFGCGSARLLRLLRCIPNARLVGTDINPECIEWCLANIPDLEFHRNEPQPPLNFARAEEFDLVIAQSVFTHIPPDLQFPWLQEIRRILKPAGAFVCTVLGEHFASRHLTRSENDTLRRDGCVVLGPGHERLSCSSEHTRQPDVYQSTARILGTFGSEFEICVHAREWHDILVLRRLPLKHDSRPTAESP